MSAMASQITSFAIVYSTVYSAADQRKHQSLIRVTGLCAGNSPVTGEFPAQRASNAETISTWGRHHDMASNHRNWITLSFTETWKGNPVLYMHMCYCVVIFNSSPPGQNGRNFADDIVGCVFVNAKFYILISVSLKLVPKGIIHNNPALV